MLQVTENPLQNFLPTWFIAGFIKRGPRSSLGATDRFSGGHKQKLSLGSFAVILHNSSVTIY